MTIVIAASAYLSTTTVNLEEYTGINWGTQAALDHNVTDLIIVGDSRIAIQQSMGGRMQEEFVTGAASASQETC